MHEMALCEGIIGIVEEQARKRPFSRVKVVCLEIGALSHVAPEAMRFCFEAVAARTIARGAGSTTPSSSMAPTGSFASNSWRRPNGISTAVDRWSRASRARHLPRAGRGRMQFARSSDRSTRAWDLA